MSDSHGAFSPWREAAQQAYEQGGRWEKQCAYRKMMGLGVDSSGWLDGKAPPWTWHLVER